MRTGTLPSTWSDRALVAVVILILVTPAVVLLGSVKPARLGFQMYSGYGVVAASWEDAEGQVRPVALGRDLASPRVEIDWTTFLPELLCERLPDAVRVEVTRTQPGATERRSLVC